jgi:hypothetical protein
VLDWACDGDLVVARTSEKVIDGIQTAAGRGIDSLERSVRKTGTGFPAKIGRT